MTQDLGADLRLGTQAPNHINAVKYSTKSMTRVLGANLRQGTQSTNHINATFLLIFIVGSLFILKKTIPSCSQKQTASYPWEYVFNVHIIIIYAVLNPISQTDYNA